LPEDTELQGMDRRDLVELADFQDTQALQMTERIAELEFELEDVGWIRENQRSSMEFSERNLMRVIQWARIMYLKNPVVNHGVNLQADYVFAQGINITTKGNSKSLDAFLFHPKNLVEFTSLDAMWAKEVRLQNEGNIFFALFTKKSEPVVIRTIPVADIIDKGDIIANPEDRKEVWYYKRVWTEEKFDLATGKTEKLLRVDYYPDWRYNPKTKPATIGKDNPEAVGGGSGAKGKVHWGIRVYHLQQGALDDMRYGLPETYQALPWARAVVRDLEDFATVKRAHARLAWKATLKGGKPAITALRNKLSTSVTVNDPVENKPPPVGGSTWAANQDYDMEPMKTGGAQPHSDAGRQIRVMAATGFGWPDNILSGDASTGALATAKTLDRPTELKVRRRQGMWEGVLTDLIAYSMACQSGKSPEATDDEMSFTEAYLDPETVQGINIDWPPILERDAAGRVDAVIAAATLDGKTRVGTMTDRSLVMILLQALGLDDDLEDYMSKMTFDEEDMLKQPEALAIAASQAGSPGGPVPGPNAGAPPDRQAQGLEKNEPAATATENRAQESALTRELNRVREAIAAGQTVEEALENTE